MSLPENAVKELLSRGFLRVVASHGGFIVGSDELDFGSDLSLSHVEAFEGPDDRMRYTKSGFTIDVQLKATCESHVDVIGNVLKYDLKASNYNDLVRRRDTNVPLVLVLFVLPDDANTWLGVADSELTLRRCGYLWRPTPDETVIENTSSKRIAIPLANRLTVASFSDIRAEYVQ